MRCEFVFLLYSILALCCVADWGPDGCDSDQNPEEPLVYTWVNLSQTTQDKDLMCIRSAESRWGKYEYNWISERCAKSNLAFWNKAYNTQNATFEQIGQWYYYWCQAVDLDWSGRQIKNLFVGPVFGPISIISTSFTMVVLCDSEFRSVWSYRYYMLIALLDCLGVMPAVVAAIMNAAYGYDNTVTNLHRFLQERSSIISDAFWSTSNTLMVALAFDRVCAIYMMKLSSKLTSKYYIAAMVFGFVDGFLRKFLQAPAKKNIWSDIKCRYEETDNNIYKDSPAYQNLLVYDSIMDMAVAILMCIGTIMVTVGLIRAGVRRKRLNRHCTETETRDRRLCILLIFTTLPVVLAIILESLYRFLESILLEDKTTRWHIGWIMGHTYEDAMRLTLIDMQLLNFDLVSHCLNMFSRSISFVLYFAFHDRIRRKSFQKMACLWCSAFKVVPASTLLAPTKEETISL